MVSSHVLPRCGPAGAEFVVSFHTVMRKGYTVFSVHNVYGMHNVHKMHLKWIRGLRFMESAQIIRKIQFRQGSFAISIPKQMARMLGVERGQYVGIVADGDRLIVSLIRQGPGPADGPERDAEVQDGRMEEEADGAPDGGTAYGEPGPDGASMLDGLRM